MDYTKIDGLLEQDENPELYELQCEIINSTSLSDDEKLLRLAIMQTNPPIDDWENAAEIIRNYVTEFHGDSLLIAAYIAATAYKAASYAKTDPFLDRLNEEYELADDRFRSVAEYLRVMYSQPISEEDWEAAMLEKSIALCPDYAMHYVDLLSYKPLDEAAVLIEKALANVKEVYSEEDGFCPPLSRFADPETMLGMITDTVIDKTRYDQLLEIRNNIDLKRRYVCFRSALDHCGSFLLELSDEDIEYRLFEEFDGDCVSFLNEDYIKPLRSRGKISQEIADMTLVLSGKFRALEGTDLWNTQAVRESAQWREILELADSVKVGLTRIVSRKPYCDRGDRKLYRISDSDTSQCVGYLTECADHPTVLKFAVIRDVTDTETGTTTPGSLAIYYKNGEKYSLSCYPSSPYACDFAVNISDDGERIYIAGYHKGLGCYDKYGKVIFKTRYNTAEQLFPHTDGSITCAVSGKLITLDQNGKLIKKRDIYNGFRCISSAETITILTSKNVAAVIDVKTLDPIIKFSLSKLGISRLFEVAKADCYYVLQAEDVNEKSLIILTNSDGQVIRKIENADWPWLSRAYLDSETNEIVLYAENRLDTDKVYRIPIN